MKKVNKRVGSGFSATGLLRRAGRKVLRTVRRKADRVRMNQRAKSFYRTIPSAEVDAAVAAAQAKDALLVTIAFNRPDLLELQAELLNQHFLDPYHLVVGDNSPSPDSRQEIRRVCEHLGVSYVPIPPNPSTDPSRSHGLALTWVHRNVLERADVAYFGYLDHDIFPIRDVSYRDVVAAQGAYGHFRRAGRYLYYWPGLHFVANDYFARGNADFRPTWFGDVYADTGASNWKRYYSKLETNDLACFELENVVADDVTRPFDERTAQHSLQEAAFTLFDRDWLHLVNGSNWAGLDTDQKTAWLHAALSSTKEGGLA